MADIIFKRGQESNRTSIIPKFGEPIVSNDNGKPRLWIGDSQTPGGIEIGASESTETISSIPSTILSFKGYKIKKEMNIHLFFYYIAHLFCLIN